MASPRVWQVCLKCGERFLASEKGRAERCPDCGVGRLVEKCVSCGKELSLCSC